MLFILLSLEEFSTFLFPFKLYGNVPVQLVVLFLRNIVLVDLIHKEKGKHHYAVTQAL